MGGPTETHPLFWKGFLFRFFFVSRNFLHAVEYTFGEKNVVLLVENTEVW